MNPVLHILTKYMVNQGGRSIFGCASFHVQPGFDRRKNDDYNKNVNLLDDSIKEEKICRPVRLENIYLF